MKQLKYIACTAALAACMPVICYAQDAKPLATPALIDPAHLKQSEIAAKALFPDGTYARMMDGMVDKLFGGLMDPMMGMKASDFTGTIKSNGEVDDAKLDAALSNKSIGEMAAERDPVFRERTKIMFTVLFKEMAPLYSELEPAMRAGIAKSLARRYSKNQIADLNAFFSTPTGAAYGQASMALYTDPEVMDASMAAVPKMMEKLPAIMKKVEEATAHLPKLKVAGASGITASDEGIDMPACAADGDLTDCSQEDKIEAQSTLASKETGEEPWYDQSKWTDKERNKVTALQRKYDAASTMSYEAYENFTAQIAQVQSVYRTRLKAQGWTPTAPAPNPAAAEKTDAAKDANETTSK